jgi:hypothetical protein
MKTNYFLLLTLLFVGLQSCNLNIKKTYSEKITEETPLQNITKIKLSGVMDFHLIQGNEQSIRLEGAEQLISKVDINQANGLLEVRLTEEDLDFFEDRTLEAYITVADLEELTFEGVGKLQSDNQLNTNLLNIKGDGVGKIDLNIQTNELQAEFNLLGDVTLRGKAQRVRLVNNGMGRIDASELVTEWMDLKSDGIGKVSVHCTDKLALEVNGIGKVTYKGDPEIIREQINGIGKVSKE